MSREMKNSGIEWIGRIPKTWEVKAGKYCLTLLKRIPSSDDQVVTCFRDGEVTLRSERREEGFTISEKEIGYQGVKKGDLVVHGMDGFAGAIGISKFDGKGSPILNVLDSYSNKQFLAYYLRAAAFKGYFLATATGIRVRSCDLRWPKLAKMPILLPPFAAQQAIADYLDFKCSQIDQLSDNIKQQIEELGEYKKALITQAITKGLDPDVEMKDSGIAWVGNIPQKWEVSPLYVCFKERKNKNKEEQENNLLSLSYGKIVRKPIDILEGLLPESFSTYNIVEKGDIIIRPTDLQNDKKSLRTGLVQEHGIITSAYIDLYLTGIGDVRYYHYLLHAFDEAKVFYNMGNGVRQGLNYSTFSKLPILTPSLEDQSNIADYLDSKCSLIDALVQTKNEKLDTLQDYKKSLVFDYVTGKKEVPADFRKE